MAMNLVFPFPTLIHQRQLKQGPNIRAFARQRNENRHVRGIILGVLAVGVEINRPLVPSHGEIVAGDVLPNSHAFRQRIPLDYEPVGPIHGLRDGAGARRRQKRVFVVHGRRGRWGNSLGVRHCLGKFKGAVELSGGKDHGKLEGINWRELMEMGEEEIGLGFFWGSGGQGFLFFLGFN